MLPLESDLTERQGPLITINRLSFIFRGSVLLSGCASKWRKKKLRAFRFFPFCGSAINWKNKSLTQSIEYAWRSQCDDSLQRPSSPLWRIRESSSPRCGCRGRRSGSSRGGCCGHLPRCRRRRGFGPETAAEALCKDASSRPRSTRAIRSWRTF